MRSKKAWWKTWVISLAGAVSGGLAPHALAADLLALHRIEPGQWDIRSIDKRDGGQTMCIVDAAVLLTLAHPGLACKRFDISNTADEATVHYSCPGAGTGQTSLRVETPRLVQIETQGILRQTPFQMRFEARRTGACMTLVR